MPLLETALDKQVLRQAGAVYQFRHADLQDRLADRYKEAARPLREEQRQRETPPLLRSLPQRAAPWRRWVVVLAMSVVIGGALLLATYTSWTRTIMGQLPADLRASCSAYAGTAATCRLPDGTVVLYQLFDTAAEARADVVNGNKPAPNCPTSAPAPESTIVCRYAVGAETGVAAFSHTVLQSRGVYEVRWTPDANPRLRGVITTTNTTAQDWEILQSNWTRLAGMQ
jgi:hypothetical protein